MPPMAQGNVFVKVVFAGYCWSKLLALLQHIAKSLEFLSEDIKIMATTSIDINVMYLCSTEEALSGKIKKWQKITWLIAEVTRHSWSCSYLYTAKLYSFDLYHTWICSSFLYHTKIYLLHNFLFWFSTTLPHFVFKKRCCFTKYAIWILERGISAILNNTL